MRRPGTLRIIAGSARGIRLAFPKGAEVRPTADRIREAIFNILADRVIEARVLDLFAGTGAFGIEALSRGASEAVFVENNRACVAAIRENLEKTRFSDQAAVIVAGALSFPHAAAPPVGPFDIIFLDPPYHLSRTCEQGSRMARLMARLGTPHLLATGGIVVFEHASMAKVPDEFGSVRRSDRRDYGSTAVSFYSAEVTER